jgi:hypothetical protein
VSNGPVKQSSYRTCICGKVCKGRAALANHGRKCPADRVRTALFVYCASNDLPMMSDAKLMANLLPVARALVDRAYYACPWDGLLDAGVLTSLQNN